MIKTREYLAGVRPEDGALVLELMHFADELADTSKLHIPKKTEVGKREQESGIVVAAALSRGRFENATLDTQDRHRAA